MRKPKTAKRMLRVIEDFLLEESREEGELLWNVLTALRGPDKVELKGPGGEEMRGKTFTVAVRATAFPRLARLHGDALPFSPSLPLPYTLFHLQATAGPKERERLLRRIEDSYEASHFLAHLRAAVRALRKIGLLLP